MAKRREWVVVGQGRREKWGPRWQKYLTTYPTILWHILETRTKGRVAAELQAEKQTMNGLCCSKHESLAQKKLSNRFVPTKKNWFNGVVHLAESSFDSHQLGNRQTDWQQLTDWTSSKLFVYINHASVSEQEGTDFKLFQIHHYLRF